MTLPSPTGTAPPGDVTEHVSHIESDRVDHPIEVGCVAPTTGPARGDGKG